MKTAKFNLLLFLIFLSFRTYSQLPAGGQWGCPAIPTSGTFDTSCFIPSGEIRLGQGYFDHFTSSDPIYAIIPENRPSYAIMMAIAWAYYRNVVGHDKMSINAWFATQIQENGFATYNGVQLPNTIYDVEVGGNVAVPCDYPRSCNNNACTGAGYCWHVGQNAGSAAPTYYDGPFHVTLDGYITANPYLPNRLPLPASTYQPKFNRQYESAIMLKTFYDLSTYRRAQYMNNFDPADYENTNDPYGVEAAQAYSYNPGPDAGGAISAGGYTPPAAGTLTASTNWAADFWNGGTSSYTRRIAAFTAVLDNNEAYAVSRYGSCCGGNAANWDFYSFYDNQIRWDTLSNMLDRLLTNMYPDVDATAFKSAVQAAFNAVDADANGSISYRYEMGGVIDAIVVNLPKDDPATGGMYAINGTGCKLGCRAPFARIIPQGSTNVCSGQTVTLVAEVEAPTSSTTYQWLRNGSVIAGATTSTYVASTTGQYSIVVCWGSYKETSPYPAVTCCAEPECKIDVNVLGCSVCLTVGLTATQNACTAMTNGSLTVNVSSGGPGPYVVTWTGPSDGTATFAGPSYVIPNLRDGKYQITVHRQADVTCRGTGETTITPVTVIKEAIDAYIQSTAVCNTQLNANITNQQPNTCQLKVHYGAMGIPSQPAKNWDKSFMMEVRANGSSLINMYEGFANTGPTVAPYDWWPNDWSGNPSLSPNTATVTVNDGDTLSLFGIGIVPAGIDMHEYVNGGIYIIGNTAGTTFTNLSTSASVASIKEAYQPPAPANGQRQMGVNYKINCPVVSPPSYTFSWSPATGLNNSSIRNPYSQHNIDAGIKYYVTATHPTNTNCKLVDSIVVPKNCVTSLPVQFIDLIAVREDKSAKIIWITAEEENLRRFEVQKSSDGITFTTFQTTTARNVSAGGTYFTIDNDPYAGITYYRVIAFDIDESKQTFSPIRSVNFNDAVPEVFVYPNPFNNNFNIQIKGLEETEVYDVEIYNAVGALISQNSYEYKGESITAGENLSQGLYILKVSFNDTQWTTKVIKY